MNQMQNSNAPAKRIKLNLQVDLRKSYWRKSKKVNFLNISQTGAYMQIPDMPVQINEKISLKLNVGSRTRKIEARVVWTNEFGAGICFLFKSNRDMQLIDDLMYFVEAGRKDQIQVLSDILKNVA